MWLQMFYFKPRRENLTGLLFCPDLSLSMSTDHRDCNLNSLHHRFQSRCSYAYCFVFSFECKHVYFYVKSNKECRNDKKAVTGSVSVPVSKTLV